MPKGGLVIIWQLGASSVFPIVWQSVASSIPLAGLCGVYRCLGESFYDRTAVSCQLCVPLAGSQMPEEGVSL
jgi:hypothetical protein